MNIEIDDTHYTMVRLNRESRYHDILTPELPTINSHHLCSCDLDHDLDRVYRVFTKDGKFFIPIESRIVDISSDVREFCDDGAWSRVRHDNLNSSVVTNIVGPHKEIKHTERCLNYKRYTKNNKPHKDQRIAYVRLKDTSDLHTILKTESPDDTPYFNRVYRVFTKDGEFFIPDGACLINISSDVREFCDDLGNKQKFGFIKYPENKPGPEEHECVVIPNIDSILFRGYKIFPIRVKTWDGKFFIPSLPTVECPKETRWCDISDDIVLFCEDEVLRCNL